MGGEGTAAAPRLRVLSCITRLELGGAQRVVLHTVGHLDPAHFEAIEGFLGAGRSERLVFVAAGTSGTVYPAAGFVDLARGAGAETWLVNAEAAENVGRFHHFVEGPSGEVLPRLFAFEGD